MQVPFPTGGGVNPKHMGCLGKAPGPATALETSVSVPQELRQKVQLEPSEHRQAGETGNLAGGSASEVPSVTSAGSVQPRPHSHHPEPPALRPATQMSKGIKIHHSVRLPD